MNHQALLEANAAAYAEVALTNVQREFPNSLSYVVSQPATVARPRELHPAFYGSFDWHSCVEMHWVLVRLLRLYPDLEAAPEINAVLDAHLGPDAIAGEVAFLERPEHHHWERPYGWGWALTLAHEAADSRWEAALRPLAELIAARFVEWLPKQTYPVRAGTHGNTAFGLARALPYARASDDELSEAIRGAALRWFADDRDYPAAWEPSGADFLSPALTEAELMVSLLPPSDVPDWLERFLPGLAAGVPFHPASVSDPGDGHIAHLHGLNLSRAWALRRLAASLPKGDPRIPALEAGAELHAEAALPYVTGSEYTVDHWLAAYALLFLSPA